MTGLHYQKTCDHSYGTSICPQEPSLYLKLQLQTRFNDQI